MERRRSVKKCQVTPEILAARGVKDHDRKRHGSLAPEEYQCRTAIRNRGTLVIEVATVIHTELKAPKYDPFLEGAAERIHAAVRELQVRGIIDEHGNRIRTDLPEDMKEGAERDFGG